MKLNFKVFALSFTVSSLFFASLFSVVIKSSKNDDSIILSTKNIAVLSGEVTGDNVSNLIFKVKKMDSKLGLFRKRPIYIFMNTPGGSVQSGMELVEVLNGLGRPINTITLFSASMGFQIVQNLGERLVLKNGILMSHRASGSFEGSFGGLKPSPVENRLSLWNSRIQELDQQTVKRTNGKQTLESYQKAYANELWLTGQQAIEGGYADRIVTVKCDASLDGVTTHSVSFFGLLIKYDLDNCPINTSPMNIRVASPDSDKLTKDKADYAISRFMEFYSTKQGVALPYHW